MGEYDDLARERLLVARDHALEASDKALLEDDPAMACQELAKGIVALCKALDFHLTTDDGEDGR
jgi:hypothetical protein